MALSVVSADLGIDDQAVHGGREAGTAGCERGPPASHMAPVRNATRRAECLGERWTAVQSGNIYHSVRGPPRLPSTDGGLPSRPGPMRRKRFTSTSAFLKTK
jgi:hypothetical protein